MAGARDLDSKQNIESKTQDSKDSIKLTKNIESKEIKLAQIESLESKKILMNSQDSKQNIDSKDSTNSITNIESRFKDSNISQDSRKNMESKKQDSIKLAMNTDSKNSTKLSIITESKEIKLAQIENLESKKILMNSQDSKENIESKDSTNSITNIESRFKDSNISLDSIKLAMNTDSKDFTKLSKIIESKNIKLAQNLESKKQDSINTENTESSSQDSKADSKEITESSSTKSYKLDAVQVSAGKTQREIFYENDNIASVSGESLQKLNIQNSKDLDKVFSGLYITNSGGSAYPSITLRGMRSGYYYSPNVRLYIDDVPQDIFFINQELLDVESVELFKGWAGSIYGENASAGIIDIHSNMATNKTKVNANVNIGSLDRSVAASASGAILQDRLYAKASFKYSNYLGQIKDSATGSLADNASSALGRVSLLYDDSKFNVGFDYYLDSGIFHDMVYLSDNEISNPNNIVHNYGTNGIPSIDRLVHTYALKAGYNFDSFSLKNVFSVQDRDMSITNFGSTWEENETRFTDELKLRQEWENDSISNYGIYLTYSDFIHRFTKGGNRVGDKNDLKNVEFALFTDHAINLPANLTLNLGLRYHYNFSDIDFTKGSGTASINSFANTHSFHNFGARVGLSYTFLSNHKIYTAISRGFKQGRFPNAVFNEQYSRFYKPEINYTAELGYKGFFWDDRIYINADYFFTYSQDRQENVLLDVTTQISTIANMGNMLSHGFEFEGKVQFLESSFFMLNFAYINAQYVDSINPFTGQSAANRHIFFLPAFNLNASLDSQLWKNNMLAIYFNTSLAYKSRIYFTDDFSQKPYTLWNLGLRFGFLKESLTLALNLENALNTLYDSYGFSGLHQIGRLRNYSATLSYKF